MAKFQRFMTKETLVSEVDISDENDLIGAWFDRVDGWFLEPLEDWPRTGHEAFVVLLSLRAVLYQCAAVLFSEFLTPEGGARAALEETIPSMAEELAGRGPTPAYEFVRAVKPLGSGALKMSDDTGISGTGKPWVLTDDGVLVFDPWVIRDLVRNWFAKEQRVTVLYPNSTWAVVRRRRAYEVLKEAFG